MRDMETRIQHLISLPPRMAAAFEKLEHRERPAWYASSDPERRKLGSAGGTAHLLHEAWRELGGEARFEAWLQATPKLIIHGGGESRRLPAYAAVGKPLMPVPVLRWSRGQRLDQTLLDLQLPGFQRVMRHAPPSYAAMVASGDVLLRFDRDLPVFPAVDVLGLGMWVRPEKASDFGVFFTPRDAPRELAFFLQKPSPTRIRQLATDYLYMVDTGMWLLSERAVAVLMAKSGWDAEEQRFTGDQIAPYELYHEFGLALGSKPSLEDPELRDLTCAVAPLPQPEFYHFGTSRQMIESISSLQNVELDETKLGLMGAKRHPDQYLQNARFEYPLRLEQNHTLWVENCDVPASWELSHDHVLTGVPPNDWDLRLDPGVCLDFVPVAEGRFCLRFYGIDDAFGGAVDDPNTRWLGRPAQNWFFARGIGRDTAGISAETDLQHAPLFPLLAAADLLPRFLEWLFAAKPVSDSSFSERWIAATRLSASEIARHVALDLLYASRDRNRTGCLRPMLENSRWSVFLKLDLASTATMYARSDAELPPETVPGNSTTDAMREVHEQMFRGTVLRHRAIPEWRDHEHRAFGTLRRAIVDEIRLVPTAPVCTVQEDQIVWGRSPARLDLAGGWTDTPPYCLEYGGKVVNLAVNLNGQPPIQVFAKLSPRPELVVRSIDLGAEQRIATYEKLDTFARPGSEFAVAKAAFALAGFLPRFGAGGRFKTLREQLEAFGGGIEVSLLAAVPKGSGLGTSSILAATILATLGDLCGLNWDRSALFTRTLALEQLLTTGGGWQDQAGGIYRGVKLIETTPGLTQKPTLRWLPDHLFDRQRANASILLYYTGLTRMAKGILREIVRGIFLNSPHHLSIIDDIGANAEVAFNALQKSDYDALTASVRNSWELNQRLDSGTNPEPVQAIVESVRDYLAATKLLGAGGGGFLVMFAKDENAGDRVRRSLEANPPNPRARFLNLTLSDTGLQLTRS